jgi:AAA domain
MIPDRTEALRAIERELFGAQTTTPEVRPAWLDGYDGERTENITAADLPRSVAKIPDDVLLSRIFAAENGEKVRALFEGDTSAYHGDHSAADLALCSHLAFWTQRDPERMDRLFRRSRLMRAKWNRADYRARTIERAIASSEIYEPPIRPIIAEADEAEAMTLKGFLPQVREPLTDPSIPPATAVLGVPLVQRIERSTELPEAGLFPGLTYEQLIAQPAPPFLVRDRLVAGSLAMLTSQPKLGKTLLAVDLAMAIGTGQKQWLGARLLAHGPVIYVIAEGVGRFKYRLMAWMERLRGLRIEQPESPQIIVVPRRVNLLDASEISKFLDEHGGSQPIFIVFDTLSRCMPGADENSAEAMGTAIANIDRIRETTGATVLVNHHIPKDGRRTPRGSGALIGAIDTQIHLDGSPDNPIFTVSCEAQRDAEPFAPFELCRRSIVLTDCIEPDTGEPVTSAIVAEPTVADRKRAQRDHKAEEREQRILFLAEDGNYTKTQLRELAGGKSTETKEAIERMTGAGQLVIQDIDGRKVLKPPRRLDGEERSLGRDF